MFGGLEGGKGYLGRQEQDGMGCLERDLSLFKLAHGTETMDDGREEIGQVVQTCWRRGRAVHEALVR